MLTVTTDNKQMYTWMLYHNMPTIKIQPLTRCTESRHCTQQSTVPSSDRQWDRCWPTMLLALPEALEQACSMSGKATVQVGYNIQHLLKLNVYNFLYEC